MNEQQNEHEKRLKQEIKTELYNQTFNCDVPHFIPKKVGNLVEILEIDEPGDEQEAAKAEKKFEEFFQHKYYREIHHNRIKKLGKRLVCTVAILALLFVTADVTTKAVMDESLFHMVGRWKDQLAIRPGINNYLTEQQNFAEVDTQYFKSNRELADKIGVEFLVCSWLPEGARINEILVCGISESPEIIWEYKKDEIKNWKLQIWMYPEISGDTACFTESIENEICLEENINGKKVICYTKNDGLLAGFKYGNNWYFVDITDNKEILELIIEGMVDYE